MAVARSTYPGARSALKLDRAVQIIEKKLEAESPILDLLVGTAVKGQMQRPMWDALHVASARDGRVAELAAAYEQLLQSTKMKLLLAPVLAEVLTRAAAFFEDIAADSDKAIALLQRALTASPTSPEAFSRLESLLTARQNTAGLVEFYASSAANRATPEEQLSLLRRAAELAEFLPDKTDQAIALYQQIVRLDPADRASAEALEAHFVRAGRIREAAKWLEQILNGRSGRRDGDELALRERLLRLYCEELDERDRALPHAEAILAQNPSHADAVRTAEALLGHRALGPRAASALAHALGRQGDFARAAAVLEQQLAQVRGAKRIELVKRLAAIKQDQLGDAQGALPLLEEAVTADVTDEEVRRRYRTVTVELGRGAEAVRVLAGAAGSVKDIAARLAIEAELGQFALERGDVAGARAAFESVLGAGADEATTLLAARGLCDIYSPDEATKLAEVLETLTRLEPDEASRFAFTERLAELYQHKLGNRERAVATWKELIGSSKSARALDALETLYQASGDDDQLATILDLRAAGSADANEARALATRAAELRVRGLKDSSEALGVWSDLVKAHGPSREAHARMLPLLEHEGSFAALADVLREEIAIAPSEEHAALYTRLGQICLVKLKDVSGALQAFRAVLAIDPRASEARRAVEALLKVPQAALAAAELLEPIYRSESQWSGLLSVLEARAKASAGLEARLPILHEMTIILEQTADTTRALRVAGEALRLAVMHGAPQIESWIGRVEQLSAKAAQPPLLAAVLSRALGDRRIDSEAMFQLAQRAGDALLASGEPPKALVLYRAALDFKPTATELKTRVEALVMEQGTLEERIAIYEAGLERSTDRETRRQLLHSIARLQSQEGGDDAAAIATLRSLLSESPNDIAAEDALLDALSRGRDQAAFYAELERCLSTAQGERRWSLLVRMAEVAARMGQEGRALAHYRELLAGAPVSDALLDAIERTAEAAGSAETLRELLERRIIRANDPRSEVTWLERLGDLLANRLGDTAAALSTWKRAAEVATEAHLDAELLLRLYQRTFDSAPGDRRMAERLVALYRERGEWNRVADVYDALLAHVEDEREAINIVLDMEAAAVRGSAVQQFTSAADAALRRYVAGFAVRARALLSAKARVLASSAEHADAAAGLWRGLIASGESGDPSAQQFEEFLARAGSDEHRHADRQWLAAWRGGESGNLDRTSVLLAAARACEGAGSSAAAVDAYRRVLEYDSDCISARFALVRLLLEVGNAEGALSCLADLRERTRGPVRAGIELRMGHLLSETLDRADDALSVILPVLEAAPSDPTALPILQRALARASSRPRAAAMLERASESAPTKQRAAMILRVLLGAPADTPELVESRKAWYQRLLDLLADRPDEALATALAAAVDFPETEAFWDSAEQLARSLRRPDPVMDAYRRLLEGKLSSELSEWIGRRALDFYEEWFEDPEGAIALLQRIQALPGGTWAFERLKLACISSERYSDLFQLYDQAIEKAASPDQAELLEEAAEAARNFARDSERAIAYLERLSAIRAGDSSTLAALERLYEKRGHHLRLVTLLTTRLQGTDDAEAAQAIRSRVAGLFIGMANHVSALATVEEMLAEDPSSEEGFTLLRRILLPDDSPPPAPRLSIAPSGISKSTAPRVDMPPPQPLTPALVERAASRLKPRYLMQEKIEDVVRIIEVELAAADSDAERTVLYQQRARMHLEELGEIGLAFDSYVILVGLEPDVEEHRKMLADLAGRLDRHDRHAEALVDAALKTSDPLLKARLRVEAARVYRDRLAEAPKAISLLASVVDAAELPAEIVLPAARELEPLLASQHVAAERCAVLDKIAALETDRAARRAALGEVARIASAVLADQDRAARAWKARLADDPTDREALDGLVLVFESARRFRELIEALDKRASLADSGQARQDRGRIAIVYAAELDAVGQAIVSWNDIRKTFGPDEESFQKLSVLLESTGRFGELAALLKEEVDVASPERRVVLWGALGDLCRDRLNDLEGAAKSYAEALRLSPSDAKARQALSDAQQHPEVRSVAQQALARAYVEGQEWDRAAALAASLSAADDVPRDVARTFWWGVATFQRDVRRDLDTAEIALQRALMHDEASVEILEALAGVQARAPGRAYILTTLRLSDVKGGDLRLLREAAEVAMRDREEPRLAPSVCQKLLDLALSRWKEDTKGERTADRRARGAEGLTAWALEQLIALADETGDVKRGVELLVTGASLPFEASERRRLKQKAAQRTAETLGDARAALAIYRELFHEDTTDAIARTSVAAFAGLLEQQNLHAELSTLWEQQAAALVESDPTAASELWHRAATLAEERLGDSARAIADHKRGAEIGGLPSLEALARLYEHRGESKEAAAVLERICELGPGIDVVANTLRLADAYAADGDKGAARARLEQAIERFRDAEPLSQRLQQLYRDDEAWEVLADFLSTQAEHSSDPGKRLSYLTQAVDVQSSKLRRAEGVIPLLRQIVELDPDTAQPRLQLANALIQTKRSSEAVGILDAQIAHYGTRKPKDRALVHHALARALHSSDKKRALRELEQAARIDPAHAEILHMLARLAHDEGKLDLANHTYQALLTLRRSARDEVDRLIGRADLFLALADIAERKNDPDRAAELRASAAEAAQVSE